MLSSLINFIYFALFSCKFHREILICLPTKIKTLTWKYILVNGNLEFEEIFIANDCRLEDSHSRERMGTGEDLYQHDRDTEMWFSSNYGIPYLSVKKKTLFITTFVKTAKFVKTSIQSAQKSADCVFFH